MNKPNGRKRGKVTDLIALASTMTLVPVLASRLKKAKREGDRLELADAALSAAALALGAAKYLRRRRPRDGDEPQ